MSVFSTQTLSQLYLKVTNPALGVQAQRIVTTIKPFAVLETDPRNPCVLRVTEPEVLNRELATQLRSYPWVHVLGLDKNHVGLPL